LVKKLNSKFGLLLFFAATAVAVALAYKFLTPVSTAGASDPVPHADHPGCYRYLGVPVEQAVQMLGDGADVVEHY
jgi:hypothetical protein